MVGFRKVTTDPEAQSRGYASTLLRETLSTLHAQEAPASILFPFSFRYYRKFGFELGGSHCHVWCRPNALPPYAEADRVPSASSPGVAAALARFYEATVRTRACCLARPVDRWSDLIQGADVWVVPSSTAEEIEGYALVRTEADRYGAPVAHVLEMRARSPAAWRALLGRLARQPVESIEWEASNADLGASGLLRAAAPLREGFKPRAIVTVRPTFQVRVVNLEAALRLRLPAFPAGRYRLAFRVEDDLLPENGRPLAIVAEDGEPRLEAARPRDPCLHTDIRVFSQCFSGFLTPGEVVSQGLATLTGPGAADTADRLFPPGEPFLSELDRF
jgi:predicted acetyltransferase